ncbi:MAG TPA: serine/threonine-protein kinase [Kofleriaceae bacterium]|nr:serine/threonine-protein kinase [Kofleriaceae bacterium]
MAGSPTRTSDQPPRRHGFDDTVPASEPPADATPAEVVAKAERYRIGIELGRGGMGRVVEAFDTQLGRTVALKEILPKAGTGTAKRFAREIQITARLEHASIVPLYDSGVSVEGRPYYVMRRVTGKPLDEMIARARGLDERLTLLPALLSAIDAVAHAHKRGVIHRDLKPANILVGELGETVVIDWGLAKVIGEEDEEAEAHVPSAADSLKTQIGSVFGTPGFMAPEQARGEALGTHGDVYALGACLYQLLAAAPPHHGNSATEVMDKTRTHDIRPLAETAPGAPPELVAIVAKALAFDPAHRYPHAGALGEDVRRFLAGQLVAAHQYTNVQKLSRFARRHRGVLGVLALATVAVAVMSWIGVHRIMTERDAAKVARQQEGEQRRQAEEARDRLVERHDALVVMQARATLDTSPTESLAILKQLSASSERLPEARALAQAAVLRGPAFGMQTTTELNIIAELDAEGRRLLQVSRDGMLRVFDLDRRRAMLVRPFATYSRAIWIAGGRVLVTHEKSPPQVLDPVTNTIEPLDLPPISFAVASERGDRVVFTTAAKTVGLLDVASRQAKPIAFDEAGGNYGLAITDGFFAVSGTKLVVVYDRDGKELARRTGPVSVIRVSPQRSVVVLAPDSVTECKLDPQPTWTEIPIANKRPAMPLDVSFRGTSPVVVFTNGDVMEWNGKVLFERGHLSRMQAGLQAIGDATVMLPGTDGKLYWYNELGTGALMIPASINRLRIAGRAGTQRLAVIGDGIVFVYQLDRVIPKRYPSAFGSVSLFVDDKTVLVMPSIDQPWEWRDLETGKTVTFEYRITGLPMLVDLEPQSGRVLFSEHSPVGMRIVQVRKNTKEQKILAEGKEAWGRLLPGGGVVFGVGDGRVFGQLGDQPARELAKLDGVAEQAVGLGGLRFAVHGTTGELIRGDLGTGEIERVRVPVGTMGFLAADGHGNTLIVEDNRLLLWDGAVTEIAKFDKQIMRVEPVEGGALLVLGQDSEVQVVEIRANAKPHRLFASTHVVRSSNNGKRVVGLSGGHALTVIDMPSRARWLIPALPNAREVIGLSPDGRLLLESTDIATAVWTLPQPEGDFAAWLDEQTNATIDADGLLVWPWQGSHPP